MSDESLQMDTTPVFSVPRQRASKESKKEGKKESRKEGKKDKSAAACASPACDDDHSRAPSAPQSPLAKTVRFILLLSLIPAMYFVPFVLKYTGGKVKNNFNLLLYAWAVYSVCLVAIFFHFKKATITINSFVTQIMIWMIITLGIYHLVDIPKMVDPALRKDVLYSWCTFTMIFNLMYFMFDDRDYKEEERKENEKEERRQKREEKRKEKEAVKRQQRLDNMMSPAKRRIVNALIYLALLGLLGYIFRFVYNYSIHLQDEQDRLNGVYREPVYAYDKDPDLP